jgi:hypothetical protein
MTRQKKSPGASLVRSSAAEYLTFVAASGRGGVEAVYADENVWLSQKIVAQLYDVDVRTINDHLKKVFADSELEEASVIRNFRITATDGAATDRQVLSDAGKVTAEISRAHAESEFEKYRIVQDRLFESDFDRLVDETRRLEGKEEPKALGPSKKGKKR